MLHEATGDQKYLDILNDFFWNVTDTILDKDEDLNYRDPFYIGKKSPNGKKLLWSRGNGWVFAAFPPVTKKEMYFTTRCYAHSVAALAKAVYPVSRGAMAANGKRIQPNVILIIGDDISVDDFGCYGHPTIRTPNVDKLAASGLRFTNAYHLTTSQCSPTRCSLITGRYSHNTRAPELHTAWPAGQVMFPAILKEAGYYTAAAGKWHLGSYARDAFDRIAGGGAGGEERWLDCLQQRPKDKPFLMWFAAYDAHRGWAPDKEATPHTPADAVIPPYMIDTPDVRKDMAQYYDEVQRLDRYTGEVVGELKKQGVFENTVIIFMADNGRPFVRCKIRLYDSGSKTPLIVHWPAGLKPTGEVSDSLVSTMNGPGPR